MPDIENSIVLIIDIQQKLTQMLSEDVCAGIESKSKKLVHAAKVLGVETIVTEQYPRGLGQTVEGIKEILGEDYKPYEKTVFNALLEDEIREKIKNSGKKQVIIAGIEAHICVLQTACALIEAGYEVAIVKDICASRSKYEFKSAMEYLAAKGAEILTLESVLFMWLKGARHPHFKEVQALIK